MLGRLSSMKSSTNTVSTMGMSSPELSPKDQAPYSMEEEETDSGSSSVGDEEVSWTCTSEEEVEATKPTEDEEHETCSLLQLVKKSASGTQCNAPFSAVLGYSAPQQQHLVSLERALELPPEKPFRTKLSSSALAFNPSADAETGPAPQQKPGKTKLCSNALVFVPGSCTSSVTDSKSSEPAGRDLLALLKGDSTNVPRKQSSESQQKPGRSKLSTSAQVFVPKVRFVPQPPVVQSSDFVPVKPLVGNNGYSNSAPPMVELLPVLVIPMCTTNFADGFDDSPRATYPDSPSEVVSEPDKNCHFSIASQYQEASIEDEDENEEAAPKASSKVSWADLYEDEDGSVDIWLEKRAHNQLLSLS